MLRIFKDDILNPDHFVITLEILSGRDASKHSIDHVKRIARDAFSDGRISAVSITDNPGGNPALSPDVIGHDIFQTGMDTIVHFTCRDTNRVGMESRALQLAMMGMKNILALSGDYAGKGFGGQGAPVFDLDSVTLQAMLSDLSERMIAKGDPDGFFAGCAISPFKYTEGEAFAQYSKLCRKLATGAQYVITQLGYDARKFQELLSVQKRMNITVPTLGSVYFLNPPAAKVLSKGRVPGIFVSESLANQVIKEWQDKTDGRLKAIERAAQLGAILKGMGYRGIHIGGIHIRFAAVGRILDRMEEIGSQWRDYLPLFQDAPPDGFYATEAPVGDKSDTLTFGQAPTRLPFWDRLHFKLLNSIHRHFFSFDSAAAPFCQNMAHRLDTGIAGSLLMRLAEEPAKGMLLNCQKCGDCAIQHVGFLCPESGCPKHTRNGACGGSQGGYCEVHPDRLCIWYRAHRRWAAFGRTREMSEGCVPPRIWELAHSSSWLNFHMRRDHQSNNAQMRRFCNSRDCLLEKQEMRKK